MQLGTLGERSRPAGRQLTIIVFDSVYNITGGQRTLTSHTIDVVAMARGAGLRNSHWAADPAHFDARSSNDQELRGDGPSFIATRTDRQLARMFRRIQPPQDPARASRPVWAWPEPWRRRTTSCVSQTEWQGSRPLPSSMAGQRMRELRPPAAT